MRHPLVHKWPNDAEYRDRCPHAPTAARSRPARRPRSPTSWTGRRCQWSRRRRGRRTGGPRSPAPSALSKVTENGSSPAGRTTDPAHLPSTPDPGCCTSAGAERTHPTAVHIPSPQQIAGLASPWRIVRFMAMASSYPPSRQSHGPPQYFAGYPVRWVISPILHSTPSACSSGFAGTQGFEQTPIHATVDALLHTGFEITISLARTVAFSLPYRHGACVQGEHGWRQARRGRNVAPHHTRRRHIDEQDHDRNQTESKGGTAR